MKKVEVNTAVYVVTEAEKYYLIRLSDNLHETDYETISAHMRKQGKFAIEYAKEKLAQLAIDFPSRFTGQEKIHLVNYAEIG